MKDKQPNEQSTMANPVSPKTAEPNDNQGLTYPTEANKLSLSPDDQPKQTPPKKKKTNIYWTIALVGALLVLAFSVFMIVRNQLLSRSLDPDEFKTKTTTAQVSTPSDTAQTGQTAPVLPDNPYNFAQLQAVNEDIYAWIEIPGTKITYPVLQSSQDDLYYLRRNYLKEDNVYGCIFTQKKNDKDFCDPNTVIYGHYTDNNTFFGNLHLFRDANFFQEHKDLYIFTPGHILTYEIFAAYEYDDRHILNSFDFSDKQVFADYLQSCLDPQTLDRNVREGVTLDTNDRIVTLSTCVTLVGESDLRYLVQGVLRNDQPTK